MTRRFLRWREADLAVFLLRLNTVVQVAREALIVYFIVRFLTPDEQGVWYTFNSLVFVAIFAELGFAEMTSQRVSRGFAKLRLEDGRLCGDAYSLDSLVSCVRHALRTYVVIVAIVMSLLFLVGYYFFSRTPRLLTIFVFFALAKSGGLLVTLLQSIYQGLDRIADVEAQTLRSSLAGSAMLLLSLASGLGLWALVVGEGLNALTRIYLLHKTAPNFWSQLVTHTPTHRFQWFKEALPIQARYGVNAVGGYLAHNLFVPMVYRVQGPAVAGQLGLTLAIMGAASKLSTAWIRSRAPRFSILVANGRRADLDRLIADAAKRTYAAYAVAAAGLLAVVYELHAVGFYSDRFLSVPLVAGLLLSYAVIMIITPWNFYLRAHGDEPWYLVSVVHGAMILLALTLVVPRYGLVGLVVAMNFIHWCILLPLGALVFIRYRRAYDQASQPSLVT